MHALAIAIAESQNDQSSWKEVVVSLAVLAYFAFLVWVTLRK